MEVNAIQMQGSKEVIFFLEEEEEEEISKNKIGFIFTIYLSCAEIKGCISDNWSKPNRCQTISVLANGDLITTSSSASLQSYLVSTSHLGP